MNSEVSPVSETELLRRAMRGDKQAFGSLYELYLDPIYRYIYYRVDSHTEAEDLTEMVFLKAWEQLPRPGKNTAVRNFRAWIYRIAHNLVVDRHRTNKPVSALDQHNQMQALTASPETLAEHTERSDVLRAAILQLDPEYQQVIVLRFVNQLSHAETARILVKKEGHVRVLQYRALQKLREQLSKEYGDERTNH
ncbi:MAG: sigma-70 family RNA polymerase sigma factor [Anaerolineales bacterium]|nr:sigma-70 family RNA polymerase sigma factor [Anaerolineales bacterium]